MSQSSPPASSWSSRLFFCHLPSEITQGNENYNFFSQYYVIFPQIYDFVSIIEFVLLNLRLQSQSLNVRQEYSTGCVMQYMISGNHCISSAECTDIRKMDEALPLGPSVEKRSQIIQNANTAEQQHQVPVHTSASRAQLSVMTFPHDVSDRCHL